MHNHTNLRKTSVITGKNNLESLHSVKNIPIYCGVTDAPQDKDILFDMQWDICKDSGVIQLRQPPAVEVIYADSHSEAVGALWQNHHQQFADFIATHSNNRILEIGGANADVARRAIAKSKKKLQWTIIDPLSKIDEIDGVNVINAFFDSNNSPDLSSRAYNAIVHSHTFEHMYDPDHLIKSLSALLKDGDTHIFSIPNLLKYL
ncbi:MAG: methyltransferase domain-containing protein, partial [Pseudomonadota bacterium]